MERGAVDLESAGRGDLAQKIEQSFEWPLAAWRGGKRTRRTVPLRPSQAAIAATVVVAGQV
ncbi:MAG: hypothetical protein WB696_13090 [Chthoniobacterales bacterium]